MKRELMGNRSVPLQKYWTWSWTNKDIYILKNTAPPVFLFFKYNCHEDIRYTDKAHNAQCSVFPDFGVCCQFQ